MKDQQSTHLSPLAHSDYQIIEGEPNIFGWNVKSENGASIGKIVDLLFDTQSNAVRYLIIDLSESDMGIGDKKVMLPIGIAHLHTENDEVILPSLHLDQFRALPPYQLDQVNANTEMQVRLVIGSPAALRIEDSIVEYDVRKFYHHHHFDRGRFYARGNGDR
ncbi:MAG: PRC-barrel domain containing protein [Pedobacter sp.]|nr:MAG: PRC-barrel domain containing protein [Pedobacter sp.]